MILQDKKLSVYTKQVAEFRGLNRLPVVADNELMDCKNMVFDLCPVLSVRKGRTEVSMAIGTPQGILLTDDTTFVVSGGTLYMNGTATALKGLSGGKKSIVEYWGKVFIFPDKKYYEIATDTGGDMGTGVYPAEGSVPDIDYACVHNNRVWGVKGNYIYASSNGWAMGAANDAGIPGWVPTYDANGNPSEMGACWFEVASDGSFKGISSWDDKIVALKEYCHHEVTGVTPSNFTLSTVSKCGTANHLSIQEVGGRLLFVSNTGVQSYGGSFENNISRNLNEDFETATIYSCGSDGIRYFLSGKFDGVDKLYSYDMFTDTWTEEDALRVVQFARGEGNLLALCDDGRVVRMRDPNSDENVKWSFSFSDYVPAVFTESRIARLYLKAKGEPGAKFKVEVCVDDGAPIHLKEVTFKDSLSTLVKCLAKRGCEHKFRISGTGNVQFFGYSLDSQHGGENIV